MLYYLALPETLYVFCGYKEMRLSAPVCFELEIWLYQDRRLELRSLYSHKFQFRNQLLAYRSCP
jgi:hypothetical protein